MVPLPPMVSGLTSSLPSSSPLLQTFARPLIRAAHDRHFLWWARLAQSGRASTHPRWRLLRQLSVALMRGHRRVVVACVVRLLPRLHERVLRWHRCNDARTLGRRRGYRHPRAEQQPGRRCSLRFLLSCLLHQELAVRVLSSDLYERPRRRRTAAAKAPPPLRSRSSSQELALQPRFLEILKSFAERR